MYAALHGDQHDLTPTLRRLHILQAMDLCRRGPLVQAALQAWLLAGQTAEEIAAKCTVDRLTILAYTMVLFDAAKIVAKMMTETMWQASAPSTPPDGRQSWSRTAP